VSNAIATAMPERVDWPRPDAEIFPGWVPEAVVFDCDGVLLDTERYCLESKLCVLGKYGVPVDDGVIARLNGRHYSVAGDVMAEIMGDPGLADQVSREAYVKQIGLYHSGECAALPGALSMVEKLASRLPVAVASSSPQAAVVYGLSAAGFMRFVRPEHVICPDAANLMPKPDPAVYAEAMARLGVAPAGCLAVEDSGSGVRSATAAGMRVLGVFTRPDEGLCQMTGHWVGSLEDEELTQWADRIAAG
jgi:HAD superfamily hydrolase (TIGR01509 family)